MKGSGYGGGQVSIYNSSCKLFNLRYFEDSYCMCLLNNEVSGSIYHVVRCLRRS